MYTQFCPTQTFSKLLLRLNPTADEIPCTYQHPLNQEIVGAQWRSMASEQGEAMCTLVDAIKCTLRF